MRLRHVIKLWQRGLHKNSIINLLRTDEDVRLFKENPIIAPVDDIIPI